jgi:ubiquinone/menaquinone biosynthesis C-methylase UbiE
MNMKNENNINKLITIQQIYDAIAAEFDITRYKPWPQTVEFIDELPENGAVLDLGCGNGRNIKYLAEVNRGFGIFGLDFSVCMLRIAKEKIKQLGLDKDVEFILGDVVKLPIADSSMDGVIYVAALHHLPSAQLRLNSLMELERILKPGGRAFISVWDFEQERFEQEMSKQLRTPPNVGEFGDVLVPWTGKRAGKCMRFYHLFYKDEFENLLKQTRLEILKIFRACDNYHGVVEKTN